jgi:hypothetical protein
VGPAAAEGKDEGAECEEDTECKSQSCKMEKGAEKKVCAAQDAGGKFARWWVGGFFSFDMVLVPGGDDVCALGKKAAAGQPPNEREALPLNDPPGYYCTNKNDGSDFPNRQTVDENNSIQLGRSDKVSGGLAAGNIRAGLSIDYALTANLLLGARLGVFFVNTYTGKAGSDDGKTLPFPFHAELRATYLLGKDALAKPGLAPMVFGGLGVSEWDAKVPVTVVFTNGQSREVDAWKMAGPFFIGLGGGLRYAFSPKAALLGGVHVNFAIGSGFVPLLGPELGMQFGF